MKRYIIAILLINSLSYKARADHITGGEMYYTYTGFSNGNNQYDVTLKLFMRCNSGRSFANPNTVSIFNNVNNTRVSDISVALSQQSNINLPDAGPCISNPPVVCYEVGYYYFTVSLPPSSSGYLLASQVNYRINGISNIFAGQVGATYTCEIPGTSPINNGHINNSASFTGSDLVVVCGNNYFSYSFAASDIDGDQLRYSFCSGYTSSSPGNNGQPPGNPPYTHLPYTSPAFSESSPLGNNVHIDPVTGLISGIAPPQGIYVVTVCVEEIRGGVVIATQRKDIQINVADCNVAAARLQDEYMLCRGPKTISINNLSQSPLITSYDWSVIHPGGNVINTSTNQTLTYTFPGPGIYSVKLIVNKGQQCSDSATTRVFYYPGFIPDFVFTGICITKPSVFTDRTATITGIVNSWKWDFGETSTTLDISSLQNPTYTYPSLGPRDVRLIVTNTDGCRDTVIQTISIIDKPPISLAFRDTLICLNDRLILQADGTGTYNWSPDINILNASTPAPTVFPTTTTTYYANLNSGGCLNRDSVKVRVVDHVTLRVMNDTIICNTDTIQLNVISNGLRYIWAPANQLINPAVKNPLAITPVTTLYNITATIGGCSANDQVTVTAIPLPIANAGRDITICYKTSAQLHATTDGTSWQWSPAATLTNPLLLDPVVSPISTTAYIFTVYEYTRGCPKPGRDTLLVIVLPKIDPSAGRDTTVVINQKLQLNATGGAGYLWSPSNHLSAANIADPVALFKEPSNGLVYKVKVFNNDGCADSSSITIKVFATMPAIFVPTAFTPNNDGKNDLLVPIAAGIKSIQLFSIYNRWGQLVFTTTINGHGWDGRINGQPQDSNTYTWMVKAIDFRGIAFFQKGHSTLIR